MNQSFLSLHKRIAVLHRNHPWLLRALELAGLFLGLLLAIWLATRSQAAPQLILIAVLYVIALNFSIPIAGRNLSPVTPVIAMSSLPVVGYEPALVVLGGSFVLAELLRPLWIPLWQNTVLVRSTWQGRLGRGGAHLLALALAGWVYAQSGGLPFPPAGALQGSQLNTFIVPSLVYVAAYFVLMGALWLLGGQPWGQFLLATAPPLLSIAILSQPFALLGAIIFTNGGPPAFVIFGTGMGAFAVIVWFSWQRHATMQQQLDQFSRLNDAGISLRETLDFQTVLAETYQQVNAIIPAGQFSIALREGDGTWRRYLLGDDDQAETAAGAFAPDDFTAWVAEHGRVLDLDTENMHFAARHDLAPPQPKPAAWLGVPLTTAGEIIGVMVLQRFDPDRPFSRWSRELLLAIAGQVSAAIQHARLYSEVVRLYNRTDEALAQRVQQLQALLNSTHEGVLMLDTTGRVVLVNPMAATLLGADREAVRDRPLAPAGVAERLGYAVDDLRHLLRRLRAGDPPETRREVFKMHRPGREGEQPERRFLERSEAPVRSEDGQLLGWLMIFHDVTEEQERAEWRTSVTRMIVHDLRNPVTTLSSNIDMMERALANDDPGRFHDSAASARRGCNDMLDMIDSLMDMTRLEAGQLVVDAEAMRVPPLLERVLAYQAPLAERKRITVTQAVAPDLPAVWADEEILRRVWINLLDNALKFTPAGGEIHVELRAEPALPEHEPGVRCILSDTGPGIPAGYKEQIFGRFTRVNIGGGQVRGTGLGLHFCKLAVEAHGGRIWAEDGPDGGSRFIFTLPGIPHF